MYIYIYIFIYTYTYSSIIYLYAWYVHPHSTYVRQVSKSIVHWNRVLQLQRSDLRSLESLQLWNAFCSVGPPERISPCWPYHHTLGFSPILGLILAILRFPPHFLHTRVFRFLEPPLSATWSSYIIYHLWKTSKDLTALPMKIDALPAITAALFSSKQSSHR